MPPTPATSGLPAKRIVDLEAPVVSLPSAGAPLTRLWGRLAGASSQQNWTSRRGDASTCLATTQGRIAHLHLIEREHRRWQQVLGFGCIASPAGTSQAPTRASGGLADQHGDDSEAYSAAKADFIEAVLLESD